MTSRAMKISRDLFRMAAACSIVLLLGGCIPAIVGNDELSMAALRLSGALAHTGEPGLPVVKLRLGRGELVAEIASTPLQAATGLAFRTSLGQNSAMLFIYPVPHRVAFHMKDTTIPLSCAYIDGKGEVLEIHDLMPGLESRVVSRSDQVQFVLEVNRGWFGTNGVDPGSRIRIAQ